MPDSDNDSVTAELMQTDDDEKLEEAINTVEKQKDEYEEAEQQVQIRVVRLSVCHSVTRDHNCAFKNLIKRHGGYQRDVLDKSRLPMILSNAEIVMKTSFEDSQADKDKLQAQRDAIQRQLDEFEERDGNYSAQYDENKSVMQQQRDLIEQLDPLALSNDEKALLAGIDEDAVIGVSAQTSTFMTDGQQQEEELKRLAAISSDWESAEYFADSELRNVLNQSADCDVQTTDTESVLAELRKESAAVTQLEEEKRAAEVIRASIDQPTSMDVNPVAGDEKLAATAPSGQLGQSQTVVDEAIKAETPTEQAASQLPSIVQVDQRDDVPKSDDVVEKPKEETETLEHQQQVADDKNTITPGPLNAQPEAMPKPTNQASISKRRTRQNFGTDAIQQFPLSDDAPNQKKQRRSASIGTRRDKASPLTTTRASRRLVERHLVASRKEENTRPKPAAAGPSRLKTPKRPLQPDKEQQVADGEAPANTKQLSAAAGKPPMMQSREKDINDWVAKSQRSRFAPVESPRDVGPPSDEPQVIKEVSKTDKRRRHSSVKDSSATPEEEHISVSQRSVYASQESDSVKGVDMNELFGNWLK